MLEKELIEHKMVTRVPLFILIVIILMFVGLLTSSDFQGDISYQIQFGGQSTEMLGDMSSNITLGIGSGIASISILLSALYLPKTLRKERQEGSLMFWRSMPVSYVTTHAVKLAFGLLIIPLICSVLVLSANLLLWLANIATDHQLAFLAQQTSIVDVLVNWFSYLARMILVAIALLPLATVALMTSQLVSSPILVMGLIAFAASFLSSSLLGFHGVSQFLEAILSITGYVFSASPLAGFANAGVFNLIIYYVIGVVAFATSLSLSMTNEASLKGLLFRS
jgi:ABC-2 type transport system permease protein